MYLHSTISLRLLANRFCRDTGRGVRVFETALTIRHDLTKNMQTPLSYVGPLIRCLGVWPLALYLQRISIAILFHALSRSPSLTSSVFAPHPTKAVSSILTRNHQTSTRRGQGRDPSCPMPCQWSSEGFFRLGLRGEPCVFKDTRKGTLMFCSHGGVLFTSRGR